MLSSALSAGSQVPLGGSWSRVVLGKGEVPALMALFVFTLLLITSPSGGAFFSLFCVLERAERAVSAFCSFSSSSLSQCEPGKNITITHEIETWWDRAPNAAGGSMGVKHRERSRSI